MYVTSANYLRSIPIRRSGCPKTDKTQTAMYELATPSTKANQKYAAVSSYGGEGLTAYERTKNGNINGIPDRCMDSGDLILQLFFLLRFFRVSIFQASTFAGGAVEQNI